MDVNKTSTLIAVCERLLKMKLGDKARLQTIKARAEQGRVLYALDKKYVEKMAAYIKYDNEPLEKTESVSSNKEEPQPTQISETLENQIPNEKTIEPDKKRTYQKILDEENGPRNPNKMRWGVAIGAAIVLAIGLVMVTGGAATGFAGMCWGVPSSVRCYDNAMLIIFGWTIFWIGLIPTIFGVRYIAKA